MRTAIIMTAILVETAAVQKHLTGAKRETVRGAEFTVGAFNGWRVATATTGKGNDAAAVVTERAIAHFKPEAAFFVGIAGGLKDVKIGDIVIAELVSSYAKGKETDEQFHSRPDPHRSNHTAFEQGQAIARDMTWRQRWTALGKVVSGHVVTGEVVIATRKTELYINIRNRFDDALAVETEGHGFLEAVHRNESVRGLVIRGISDLLVGKSITDMEGSQDIAADAAAAVAFEVLSRLPAPTQVPSPIAPTAAASVVEIGEIAPGRFAWTGAVTLADAGRLWDESPPVDLLRIAVRPDAPPRLRNALLRLLCHAEPDAFKVEVSDHERWRRIFNGCLDKHMPINGPPEWRASWGVCPSLPAGSSAGGETAAELARRIETALDRCTLDALDVGIQSCINGPGAGRNRYGIAVEMELGERLLELWDRWKADMDEPTRRRFLEMLASIHDGDGKPHGLIGVGRQTLVKCLVPAAVLALVVAECGDAILHPDGTGPLKPHHEAPGNLGSLSLRGHSCAVEWVDGGPIEHWLGALEELPWMCRVIILGSVRSPQNLARARQRPIGHQSPDGRLTDNSLSHPIALVFDHGFSTALKSGHDAVEQHLRDVFRARLREQARYLERLTTPTKQESVLHD